MCLASHPPQSPNCPASSRDPPPQLTTAKQALNVALDSAGVGRLVEKESGPYKLRRSLRRQRPHQRPTMAFKEQIAQDYANTHQHGETADGTAVWHCISLSLSASSQALLTLTAIRRAGQGRAPRGGGRLLFFSVLCRLKLTRDNIHVSAQKNLLFPGKEHPSCLC
jgi:hypothetical protein